MTNNEKRTMKMGMKRLMAVIAAGTFAYGFIKGVQKEMDKHDKMTDEYADLTRKMSEEAEKAQAEISEDAEKEE